jgi:decaprenylphospho-beta-D-erythro-pentofuranosid-2-ulose 2-reductase
MTRILIVGATSAIASACARLWAAESARFFLMARDGAKLQHVASDLQVRGAAEVGTATIDFNDTEKLPAAIEAAFAALGAVDIALIAHGTLSDQARCQTDVSAALHEIASNATSHIAVLTLIANRMAAARAGMLAVISSVAGDRGRASNYVYGSAKAAVSAFCEGLGMRLLPTGVRVLTIKPGPVATPMTAGLKMSGLIVASPERVAKDIVRAVRRNASTLYTPWFWRPIMFVIRALPAAVLRRLPI